MAAGRNTVRPRCRGSRADSSIGCLAAVGFSRRRPARWAAASAPSACGPATAIIIRFRSRPRRIASATTSKPASACARRRKFRSTPITIPARKWRRRFRSTAGSTRNFRPRSNTARRLNPACSCRKPGESWADALKVNGPDDTVAPGDVVVTDQDAKRLSQPRIGADGKPIRTDPRAKAATEPAPVAAAAEQDPKKRKVRTVGPTFLPVR